MTQKELLKELEIRFWENFGDAEVRVKREIVLLDDTCGFMSSGAKARLTKLRMRNHELEIYYDFWGGGWYGRKDFAEKNVTDDKLVKALASAIGVKIKKIINYEIEI